MNYNELPTPPSMFQSPMDTPLGRRSLEREGVFFSNPLDKEIDELNKKLATLAKKNFEQKSYNIFSKLKKIKASRSPETTNILNQTFKVIEKIRNSEEAKNLNTNLLSELEKKLTDLEKVFPQEKEQLSQYSQYIKKIIEDNTLLTREIKKQKFEQIFEDFHRQFFETIDNKVDFLRNIIYKFYKTIYGDELVEYIGKKIKGLKEISILWANTLKFAQTRFLMDKILLDEKIGFLRPLKKNSVDQARRAYHQLALKEKKEFFENFYPTSLVLSLTNYGDLTKKIVTEEFQKLPKKQLSTLEFNFLEKITNLRREFKSFILAEVEENIKFESWKKWTEEFYGLLTKMKTLPNQDLFKKILFHSLYFQGLKEDDIHNLNLMINEKLESISDKLLLAEAIKNFNEFDSQWGQKNEDLQLPVDYQPIYYVEEEDESGEFFSQINLNENIENESVEVKAEKKNETPTPIVFSSGSKKMQEDLLELKNNIETENFLLDLDKFQFLFAKILLESNQKKNKKDRDSLKEQIFSYLFENTDLKTFFIISGIMYSRLLTKEDKEIYVKFTRERIKTIPVEDKFYYLAKLMEIYSVGQNNDAEEDVQLFVKHLINITGPQQVKEGIDRFIERIQKDFQEYSENLLTLQSPEYLFNDELNMKLLIDIKLLTKKIAFIFNYINMYGNKAELLSLKKEVVRSILNKLNEEQRIDAIEIIKKAISKINQNDKEAYINDRVALILFLNKFISKSENIKSKATVEKTSGKDEVDEIADFGTTEIKDSEDKEIEFGTTEIKEEIEEGALKGINERFDAENLKPMDVESELAEVFVKFQNKKRFEGLESAEAVPITKLDELPKNVKELILSDHSLLNAETIAKKQKEIYLDFVYLARALEITDIETKKEIFIRLNDFFERSENWLTPRDKDQVKKLQDFFLSQLNEKDMQFIKTRKKSKILSLLTSYALQAKKDSLIKEDKDKPINIHPVPYTNYEAIPPRIKAMIINPATVLEKPEFLKEIAIDFCQLVQTLKGTETSVKKEILNHLAKLFLSDDPVLNKFSIFLNTLLEPRDKEYIKEIKLKNLLNSLE